MWNSIVNLEEVLSKKRSGNKNQDNYLEVVKSLLEKQQEERNKISETLSQSKNNDMKFTFLDFDLLDTKKIFHITEIEKTCIEYRLRFLDSSRFNQEIPEEAISAIHHLERKHQTIVESFKIMAPSKAFNLDSYDDPLLFTPIGNDYFYLIHKWGNDLNAKRKWTVYPFRNLATFTFFCVLASLFITYFIPVGNFAKKLELAKLIIFLFVLKSVLAAGLYYFFLIKKNFNNIIWNSAFHEN
jgi:hypothetical protein